MGVGEDVNKLLTDLKITREEIYKRVNPMYADGYHIFFIVVLGIFFLALVIMILVGLCYTPSKKEKNSGKNADTGSSGRNLL